MATASRGFFTRAIHEAWPAAVEVAEPTADMYEFDAIIDDEPCPIDSVSIMHDPEQFDWWAETLVDKMLKSKF